MDTVKKSNEKAERKNTKKKIITINTIKTTEKLNYEKILNTLEKIPIRLIITLFMICFTVQGFIIIKIMKSSFNDIKYQVDNIEESSYYIKEKMIHPFTKPSARYGKWMSTPNDNKKPPILDKPEELDTLEDNHKNNTTPDTLKNDYEYLKNELSQIKELLNTQNKNLSTSSNSLLDTSTSDNTITDTSIPIIENTVNTVDIIDSTDITNTADTTTDNSTANTTNNTESNNTNNTTEGTQEEENKEE